MSHIHSRNSYKYVEEEDQVGDQVEGREEGLLEDSRSIVVYSLLECKHCRSDLVTVSN